jgi:phosphoglycolate phosphatase
MSAVSFPLTVEAVTIDLDGTLLDTIPDLAAAANRMLADLGRPALPADLIRTFVGKGIPRLVERTLKASFDGAVEPVLRGDALAIFERHYVDVNGRHTTVYPGVQEGLDALREDGIPLACVTNKSTRFTLPLLEMIGFARYFERIVAGDTVERKKPDPAPLLHACRLLAVHPGRMLMIGDSLNDTQAARAAGCPVICVTYGYNEGHDVRELDSDALVDSLADAARMVRKA